MDKIHDFFQLVQAWKMWHIFFHDYIWLDWMVFAGCVIAVIVGLRKGFDFFFGKFIHLLIVTFTVILLYPWLSDWISARITFSPTGFWKPFFFLMISMLSAFLIQKVTQLQPKKGPAQFQPFWDRLVGAFAGFFFILLMLSFISQFVLLLPAQSIKNAYENNQSRYGYILRDFVPCLVEGTLTPIRSIINHKVPKA